MKSADIPRNLRRTGRSPHGERGLKSFDADRVSRVGQSLSSWRAWIEMFPNDDFIEAFESVALLMESVD